MKYIAAFLTGALTGLYVGAWFLSSTPEHWRSGDYDPATDTFTEPRHVHRWTSSYTTGTSGPLT